MIKMGKWKKSSPELIERFLTLTNDLPAIEPRKMFGYPCAFIKGNLFTGLHEENMILRLNEADRETFLKKYSTHLFEPMKGRPMKEYVVVPKEVISNTRQIKTWLDKSMQYAASIPPKKKRVKKKVPTKK